MIAQTAEKALSLRRHVCLIQLCQLVEQLPLPLGELFWRFDVNLDKQVSLTSGARIGDSAGPDSEDFARLCAGGNLQWLWGVERGDFDRGAESGLSIRDRKGQDQVMPVALEKWMLLDRDEAIAVTGGTTFCRRLAFAAQSHAHSVVDARWNGDREGDGIADVAMSPALAAVLFNDSSHAAAGRAVGLDTKDARRLYELASAAALSALAWLRSGLGARP